MAEGKKRFVPSPSATFRYLSEFHDPSQEKTREKSTKKAFIPASNDHLKGLAQINKELCMALNSVHPYKTATLDMDATLVETTKKNALYCYKKFKAYQPLNTWWDEQGILLHTEFRDGFLNLNLMMKMLALEPSMTNKRMKAIHFSIINLPGRIIERSRTIYLRLSKGHPSLQVLVDARKRIAMLQVGLSG